MSKPFMGAVGEPPLLPDGQSKNPMKILYYLTAHGYGHAVRTSTICNELSGNIRLIFRTTIPENFFREEVKRPFEYLPGQFDCGCIQNDSVTVDKRETLQAYMTLAEQNAVGLEEEIRFCRDQRIDGIVSDITPLAFEVARRAGVPSAAVANFTWFGIYEPYVREYPSFAPFLEKIRRQYQMADLLLELMPSMEMPYFENRVKIPPVAKLGRNRSRRLKEYLGLEKDRRIALIYVGELGMGNIRWGDLEKFGGWDFVGIYPISGASANYHHMDKKSFPYEDLVASAELMVTKIGYGVVSQALINGTPLIYLPREDFAEFPVLEKAIQEWGHGYRLSKEDYCTLQWERVFEEVSKRGRPKPVPSEGGKICAREIENLIRRSNPQKFPAG
jgi:L-arabinokinase